MKKIPNIFKPNIDHQIKNNRNVYYSFIEEKTKENEIKEEPVDTINRLIKENSYVFNKKVIIKTNNNEYHTKIAGKIGEKIITTDGNTIYLNDIIKISEQ